MSIWCILKGAKGLVFDPDSRLTGVNLFRFELNWLLLDHQTIISLHIPHPTTSPLTFILSFNHLNNLFQWVEPRELERQKILKRSGLRFKPKVSLLLCKMRPKDSKLRTTNFKHPFGQRPSMTWISLFIFNLTLTRYVSIFISFTLIFVIYVLLIQCILWVQLKQKFNMMRDLEEVLGLDWDEENKLVMASEDSLPGWIWVSFIDHNALAVWVRCTDDLVKVP